MPHTSLSPIHTRTIGLIVSPVRDGRRLATGWIRDIRHAGYTYTGPLRIGPGLVHDMTARLELDVATGVVRDAQGHMTRGAFPGGVETAGERCQDVLANVATLAGAVADDTFAGTTRARIGRERGCYHLTNTILALGAVLRHAQTLDPASPHLRFFQFDALEAGGNDLRFDAQVWERWLHGRRIARLGITVAPPSFVIRDVVADGLPTGVAVLDGVPLLGGFGRVALERFAAPEHELTRELSLGLSAMVTQGMVLVAVPKGAVVEEQGPSRASATCWMWRQGGPAERLPATRTREPLPDGDPRFTPVDRAGSND